MTAGNVVADDFPASHDMLVVAHNTGGVAYTVTITSQASSKTGRTGDVNVQSLAAGEIRIFRLVPDGWADSSGNVNVVVENALVFWGIIVL
jgi:hypothetical protein